MLAGSTTILLHQLAVCASVVQFMLKTGSLFLGHQYEQIHVFAVEVVEAVAACSQFLAQCGYPGFVGEAYVLQGDVVEAPVEQHRNLLPPLPTQFCQGVRYAPVLPEDIQYAGQPYYIGVAFSVYDQA